MGKRVFVFVLVIAMCGKMEIYAQQGEPKKTFNELYQPLPVILRLSYENFRNIKLLHAAILNYGGGEEEFDRLVDEYAEASSLYFRNEYILSANKFTENEKNIAQVAEKLAKKYKEIAEEINKKTIKMKVAADFRFSLLGRKGDLHEGVDEAIRNGGFSLTKANDLFARARYIDAIYFYRRSKENNFKVYEILSKHFEQKKNEAIRRGKKEDIAFFEREEKRYQLPEEYKKDVIDNKNKVYLAGGEREKEK
ncbi:MAG: hypothetical protein N2316_01865 [Spirochaetes bacterium]|nr:hypothetical protein [Spirochaetota bacterium]